MYDQFTAVELLATKYACFKDAVTPLRLQPKRSPQIIGSSAARGFELKSHIYYLRNVSSLTSMWITILHLYSTIERVN